MCVAGYEATDTVHIVNGENEPVQFTFVEGSCHAAGYTVNLAVEPMHGTVPAKSRFVCCMFAIEKPNSTSSLCVCGLTTSLNSQKDHSETDITRMWANAQRDGRPAEYRWRPLVNAAKFG